MSFKGIFVAAILGAVASGALATPIGTLEANGRFEMQAEGSADFVRFDQSSYTWFSGDTIHARSGEAVLNLTSGGGIGFTQGSRVRVEATENNVFVIEILAGSVLYAFPEANRNFRILSGNFEVSAQADDAQRLNVASVGNNVGMVERLEDGNIKVSVRSGAMHVSNGGLARYSVSAGETVGLLDLPGQTIRTQGQVARPVASEPLVLIQSPERVGTNEEFLIRWESAEAVDGDYVVIAESGAEPDEFESLVNSDEGNELQFEAPGDPGDYEIRFIDGQTGEVKRFVYLDVVQDVIGAYWWDNPAFGGILAATAGATGIYIVTERDGGGRERPVSP